MLNQKGQQYSVFKLLQGGILSMMMLMIVYGIVTSVSEQVPESSPFSISQEILSSAYQAAGTDVYFTRESLLVEQEFEAESLKIAAGLPRGRTPTVGLICRKAFCEYDGEPLTGQGDCSSFQNACNSMKFISGDNTPICAICTSYDKCYVVFGEREC